MPLLTPEDIFCFEIFFCFKFEDSRLKRCTSTREAFNQSNLSASCLRNFNTQYLFQKPHTDKRGQLWM